MKRRILIGSVLKPVDDVRHYHKLAKSLASNNVEIHIFGYPSSSTSEATNIVFHPSKKFNRISFTRAIIGLRFLRLAMKLKPDIVITCTHELLKTAFYIKLFTKAKVIYDVQENYYRNILFTDSFPWVIRFPIALLVRMNEWISSMMIDNYFLAEKCYLDEMGFLNKSKCVVLENKFKENSQKPIVGKRDIHHYFITGTLSKHYGVNEGITFFQKLNQLRPNTTLSIVGVCRDFSLLEKLNAINSSHIHTRVDTKPVSHTEILGVIENGGIALLPYQPNKATKNRIPTKIYEYLYYQVPMIIQYNPVWEELLKPYNAAIFIDFKNAEIESVLAQIDSSEFYSGKQVGDEILWKSEVHKLIEAVKNI